MDELLSQLTLEEKISMIHGAGLFRTGSVDRLGIPSIYMSDGPMGVRAEFADNEWRNIGNSDDYVSYLTCNSAICSTWNRELAYEAGKVLGEETRGRGKDVILAPGINIKRSPLCGRNFEYMSEDPRLIEEMVVPIIQGIQENDVAACVKHFAVNSQETQRLEVDIIVDEQTLQEIYFPGFLAAVQKGGVFSLMGAYNKLNGEFCSMSKSLLNHTLRDKWQFDGMVVSDWGAVHNTKEAVESALDIEMDVTYHFDQHFMANPLLEKIRKGEIEESLIDEKIKNILRMMIRLKMIGPDKDERKAGTYNTMEHQQSALNVARESIILLKNDNQLLPLQTKKDMCVAVIGENATVLHAFGGGSAEIKPLYEVSPLLGIKKLLGGNARVMYAPGYYVPKKEAVGEINWQAESTKQSFDKESNEAKTKSREDMEQQYLQDALKIAKEADYCIFVGGLNHDYDVEGLDRKDMKLPYGQDRVLLALLEQRPDTVVVMYAGSPVEMPWMKHAKAVLWSYYAGMEGGAALAEIIFGKVNPSGKLAETFIRNADQCPAHTIGEFGKTDQVEYKEGVMVGYRYYDTYDTDVIFPFGHGLSYTSFEYGNLKIDGNGTDYKVSCDIKNIGPVRGKEIVQLYVAPKNPGKGPKHELKAFDKIELQPGETRAVELTLEAKDFSHYDVEKHAFTVVPGEYQIQLGASSRDIRLCASIEI